MSATEEKVVKRINDLTRPERSLRSLGMRRREFIDFFGQKKSRRVFKLF
ncbi:hypothetical protein [Fischerella sp. PCC 9605]|nr:hypothetical protein [Fischerella sp. PCC 9605]